MGSPRAVAADVQALISRVCMDLHPGERVRLGAVGVEIEVVSKSGRATRLRITAPRVVSIERVVRRGDVPSIA